MAMRLDIMSGALNGILVGVSHPESIGEMKRKSVLR